MKKYFGLSLLVVCLVITACNPAVATSTATSAPAVPTALPPTVPPPTVAPRPTAVPTQPPAPTVAPKPAGLPAAPQPIEFQTTDGKGKLSGLFYPAADKNAPVVVLMHWVNADQSDWAEIAFWLQNRGLGGQSANPNKLAWLDPSWFPKLPENFSLNVFTFSFRGCEGAGGCKTFTPREWLLDANSAMNQAAKLEGVDPQRMVSIGASIGADGAIDGCSWLAEVSGAPGKCLGAFSLSPGNYLTVDYAEAVNILQIGQPPKPAWCLAAEKDSESAPTCKSATGAAYRSISFPGSAHGMRLIDPKTEPKVLELMLEWLKLSLGL